ncbi:acyl-CoA thioesterase [Lentibacillus saliphilus]|uniref:acyl-CoA thioesterase n=1 Tax=Lentibacillus saliphilus TaxID=2737028 RepID=UPI001C2F48C3|nr:thioesterase family protein [Lentibacillus saliphilus]
MKSIAYIENMATWREEFSFSIPIKIRFSETDMFGHVNNVSAFTYFEEARIEFLKSLNLFSKETEQNGVPVVADLQCDYHKQMYFDDRINVYVKAHQVGTTSVDLHYMAINAVDAICLTGRGRLVYVNRHTGKPVPLNDDVKRLLMKG